MSWQTGRRTVGLVQLGWSMGDGSSQTTSCLFLYVASH